jgi:protein tyrosine/serine phosphatase
MLCVGAAPELRAGQGKRSKHFPHDCNPTRIADKDIANFHQVDADLYRGGRPAYGKDVYLKLAELGIRTIVNLETGEANKEEAEVKRVNQVLSDRHLPQIKFIHFPISPFPQVFLTGVSDKGEHGIPHLFAELQQAPKPIFLHCERGKDRTGAIVALYRMRRHELPFDRAYQEALHYRFNESLDGGLIKTIRRYQDSKRLADLPDPDASAAPTVTVCVGGSTSAPMPVSVAPSSFFAKSPVH